MSQPERPILRAGWVVPVDPCFAVIRDGEVVIEDGAVASVGRRAGCPGGTGQGPQGQPAGVRVGWGTDWVTMDPRDAAGLRPPGDGIATRWPLPVSAAGHGARHA